MCVPGRGGYRGLLPAQYLDGLKPEKRAAHYTFGSEDPLQPSTTVALLRGVIRGFATTAPAQETDVGRCGELRGLYVDPDWWRRGIGAALLAEAQRRLVEQGFTRALLWVLEGNARAERFYLKHGWHMDGMRRNSGV